MIRVEPKKTLKNHESNPKNIKKRIRWNKTNVYLLGKSLYRLRQSKKAKQVNTVTSNKQVNTNTSKIPHFEYVKNQKGLKLSCFAKIANQKSSNNQKNVYCESYLIFLPELFEIFNSNLDTLLSSFNLSFHKFIKLYFPNKIEDLLDALNIYCWIMQK